MKKPKRIPQRTESSFYNNPSVEYVTHGLEVKPPKYIGDDSKIGKHLINHEWKRGKITTFSRNSSRLLREKLNRCPDKSMGYYSFGVTFTLPLNEFYAKDEPIEFFRLFWKRFKDNLYSYAKKGRLSDSLFYAWRVELTKNRVPHLHTLIYTKVPNDILIFKMFWLKLVKKYYGVDVIPDVAVDIREITTFEGAYKYFATHASKHKKSQLGWQGRQWGFNFLGITAKKDLQNAIECATIYADSGDDSHKYKLCRISFKSYWQLKRILRKLYKGNYFLSSLKTQFLIEDTKAKILRFVMEC